MQIATLVTALLCATFAGSLSAFSLPIVKGFSVFIYPLAGLINGFCSGRLYSFMHGADWIALWLCTACFFPMSIGSGLMLVDLCEYIETGRSQTISLSEGFGLAALFLVVNLPMTFFGTVCGYKWKELEPPTKISRVPRDPP